jgi:hypothetical protein
MTEQEILAEYFRQCAGKGPKNVEPFVLAIDGKWFVMTRVPWRSETFNLTLATAYPGAEGKTIVDVVSPPPSLAKKRLVMISLFLS